MAIEAAWLSAQQRWMPFRWGPKGSTACRSCWMDRQDDRREVSWRPGSLGRAPRGVKGSVLAGPEQAGDKRPLELLELPVCRAGPGRGRARVWQCVRAAGRYCPRDRSLRGVMLTHRDEACVRQCNLCACARLDMHGGLVAGRRAALSPQCNGKRRSAGWHGAWC
jgi:hypothetical protein